MRFNLSSEQEALADAATGLLDACATHHRAAAVDGPTTFDEACWRRASDELGLPGVAVDDEHGGAGGTLLDAAVVLEVAGRTLSTLPLWASIGAGRIIAAMAAPELSGELLAEVAAGNTVPGWIGVQPTHYVQATETEVGGRYILNGRPAHVIGGTWLSQLLVIAETASGLRLFAVMTSEPGVTVSPERSLDPTRHLVTVEFDAAPAIELSNGPVAPDVLATVQADIGVLLAADQVGTAQGALDMAVDYANNRQQFGRAIGSFQSLKHLLADAYVDVATARDTMRYGAWALSAGLEGYEHTASLTRATVTPRSVRVCAANIQVHGGIGYTWEHGAHLYYKRSLSAAHLLDEVDNDLDCIADHIGLGAAPS